MKTHFSILKGLIFSLISLVSSQTYAGLDPCSLLTPDEVSQVMETSMRSSPIMDDRCYFIGEHRELTIIVMDKASYDGQKQSYSSPLAQQHGAKIEPLPGISSEALYLPAQGGLNITFAKGANAVMFQLRTGQDASSDTATAQALGKLVIQRLP